MDGIGAVGRARQADPWTRRRSPAGGILARLSGVKQINKALEAGDAAALSGREDRVELSPEAWAMLTRLDGEDGPASLTPEAAR